VFFTLRACEVTVSLADVVPGGKAGHPKPTL